MAPACQLCWGGGLTWKRNNGLYQHFCQRVSCPYSSQPEASQFSFIPYVPGAFPAVASALKLIASEIKKAQAWALKQECLGFQESSLSIHNLHWFSQSPWGSCLIWKSDTPLTIWGSLHAEGSSF